MAVRNLNEEETPATDVASQAFTNTVAKEKTAVDDEAKKDGSDFVCNPLVDMSQKCDFNYADHGKSTADEPSARTDAHNPLGDTKSTAAISVVNQIDENPDLLTESLSSNADLSNAGHEMPTNSAKTRKRKISTTLSDICSMFEKKAKHSTDDQASHTNSGSVESKFNQTRLKRLPAKSLPARVEDLLVDGATLCDINEPISTRKDLMDRLKQLTEPMKSCQQPINHNHPSEIISSYYNTEAFYNTLKFFQERAMAGNKESSATTTKFSSPLKDWTTMCTVESGANMTNDVLTTEKVQTQSGMNSGQISRSVDEFNKLIEAILSGHSSELSSPNGLSADQVMASYHKSKEFYDTLMFFEEKARSGNRSAITVVSAMKKFSTRNIINQRRSLPVAETHEADVVTSRNQDVTDSQHAKNCSSNSRRRSTPMDFAPTDREECMGSKGHDACCKYADGYKSYSTDSTVLQHRGLTPNKPISNHKIEYRDYVLAQILDAHRHGSVFQRENASLSANDTSFSSVQLTSSESDQESKISVDDFDFNESLSNTAIKTQSATRTCTNSRDLFKAAIFVAEKQHIDINLVPSAMVKNLDNVASFLRLRMSSHRIPFNSLGSAIMDFISPYRYKPLARVMLEDLTPDEEEQLIQDLHEAVRYFPHGDVRDLAQGAIASGPLYLAVSKVVNNFVSRIYADRRILAPRQGIWNSCI